MNARERKKERAKQEAGWKATVRFLLAANDYAHGVMDLVAKGDLSPTQAGSYEAEFLAAHAAMIKARRA